ncbi:hypothetical protein QAD02_011612 [Eretmocerus hayati]|uniref:Uncharacterized protein n=1 Tax=Eretmocerus hayati TaxID=131215 RepID=A0ACC2NYF8_9HYME|nr:hypothetical protein QAD02_011612 [Eretmocerus hayati]
MGIPGLMTYINRHSDIYLQYYALHNTYLVIDGNSIASQLYNNEAKCNSCFGGDYDKYAYCVANFFDDLLKCNVTPLIIIDGGAEDKKLSTIYKRTKDRIVNASNMTPIKQSRTQLFPLLLKEVFKSVAIQKGIKFAQSLFEADEDIASVARILKCPVLSLDSDFYIFDVMYIPYNTLDSGVSKNLHGDGYVKNCKMYQLDHFLQTFQGLDKRVVPLAATLLGNDYIDRRCFNDFFCTLKLSRTSKRRFNEQQRRIHAVFTWLQTQTLDSAITKVLSKLDPRKREQVLEVMEMIINGYLVASPRMMSPLGFSYEFVHNLMRKMFQKPYKFQQDVSSLYVVDEPKADDESDLSCHEDDNPPNQDLDIVKPENINELCKMVPRWFLQEFNSARFPSYFIDMVTRQIYFCPVQIEDFSQPTCINISLKIIRVIFKLLSSGSSNSGTLEYVTRGTLTNITRLKLQCDDQILNCRFPPLSQLPDLPLMIRKEILDSTLGITEPWLDQFHPEWRLYLATMKYWLEESDPPFRNNCYLYSLLFCMLFHIIDRHIGFHRSQAYCERKFGEEMNTLRNSRSSEAATQNVPAQNMSVYTAYSLVNREDCLLAAPFFLSNFIMDQQLLTNPKKFHVSAVHGFSLFQNSLRHSTHLNALLGFPYQHPNFADFYNGTLLYNLYNNFKSRRDIDLYVATILGNSPSLLQLFVSIMNSVRSAFSKAFDNTVNTKKRRRHNRNRQGDHGNVPENEVECIEEFHEETPYQDINNRYAALNVHYFDS